MELAPSPTVIVWAREGLVAGSWAVSSETSNESPAVIDWAGGGRVADGAGTLAGGAGGAGGAGTLAGRDKPAVAPASLDTLAGRRVDEPVALSGRVVDESAVGPASLNTLAGGVVDEPVTLAGGDEPAVAPVELIGPPLWVLVPLLSPLWGVGSPSGAKSYRAQAKHNILRRKDCVK